MPSETRTPRTGALSETCSAHVDPYAHPMALAVALCGIQEFVTRKLVRVVDIHAPA